MLDDVARKLMILGREIRDLSLELSDVALEGLVPGHCSTVPARRFWRNAAIRNVPMHGAAGVRHAQIARLRYVGALNAANVSLHALGWSKSIPRMPSRTSTSRQNIVRFVKGATIPIRFRDSGPWGGSRGHGGGVFADVLRVCAYLGAKL